MYRSLLAQLLDPFSYERTTRIQVMSWILNSWLYIFDIVVEDAQDVLEETIWKILCRHRLCFVRNSYDGPIPHRP